MVGRKIIAVLLLVHLACSISEPADERLARDAHVGIIETDAYRFEASEGLLHVLAAQEEALTARATAAQFQFTLTRKQPSLQSLSLHLSNLPPDLQLVAPEGVLTDNGAEDPALHLGRSWTVHFPEGVDQVALNTVRLPEEDFTFLAFGDIQAGISRFDDVINAVNQEQGVDFILMLGDLTQRSTSEQFADVAAAFEQIRWPIYATPGNHDVFHERAYQDRYGRGSYSFLHKGVRFTSVDSASGGLAPGAWAWIENWLHEGRNQLQVAFSHIPAIESLGIRGGQWNAPREGRKFVGIAIQERVDLLLFGHIHTHDAFSLGGIPTHISGGCGAIEERLDGIDRHYLRIHASPSRGTLSVEVIRIE